jgi:hypothetical protein
MVDVFISFSSKDTARVARIHARLIERGFDIAYGSLQLNRILGETATK